MHGETAVGVGGSPDTATVDLNDRTAYGEPHPQSLRLRADEVPEDLLQVSLRYADTRVRDLDDHTVGWVLAGPDRDRPWAVAAGADGITGVQQDVEQHLLELHGVAKDRRDIFLKDQPDVDPPDEHGGMEQLYCILDQRFQVHGLLLHVLPAKQRAHAVDDARGV